MKKNSNKYTKEFNGWKVGDIFMFIKDIRSEPKGISEGEPKILYKAWQPFTISNINKSNVFFKVGSVEKYVRLIPKRMAPATETARLLYEYK